MQAFSRKIRLHSFAVIYSSTTASFTRARKKKGRTVAPKAYRGDQEHILCIRAHTHTHSHIHKYAHPNTYDKYDRTTSHATKDNAYDTDSKRHQNLPFRRTEREREKGRERELKKAVKNGGDRRGAMQQGKHERSTDDGKEGRKRGKICLKISKQKARP